MRTKTIKMIICSLVVTAGMFGQAVPSSANEGTGGQVIREGKISFIEESTEPTSASSSTQPSTTASSSPNSIKKPVGRVLPSMGELVKNYGIFGLGIFLLLLLFIRRKKKEEQE